jgi:flagellar operon protein (TIGR03826 family)
MNLVYCPRCNKLYAKNMRDMCNNCHNQLEKDYERCIEYLKENKGLNIQQLADDTEISVKQITRWLREGRISLFNAPNMSYPCESCGTLIRESNLCESCRTRLSRDMKNTKGPLQVNPDESKYKGAYQIGNRLRDRQ